MVYTYMHHQRNDPPFPQHTTRATKHKAKSTLSPQDTPTMLKTEKPKETRHVVHFSVGKSVCNVEARKSKRKKGKAGQKEILFDFISFPFLQDDDRNDGHYYREHATLDDLLSSGLTLVARLGATLRESAPTFAARAPRPAR